MKNIVFKSLFLGGLLCLIFSCTNLDEDPYLFDKVTGKEFGKTKLEINSAVAAAYSNLSGYATGSPMQLNEVTTDEMVVPTRGPDWGDGGHWVRLKEHTYAADDPAPEGGWNFCYSGITTCNRLIANLTEIDTDLSLSFLPEIKTLRAIYYYWLLDWYGNVPLSIDFADTEPPTNATRQEIYNFVESELLTNAPLLKKPTTIPDIATYGRVNFYTAQACLAKLYLNAEIYTGKAEWDNAISASNEIINSSIYELAPNYVDNFVETNQNSKEFIWAIPYDEVKFRGFGWPTMTLSQLSQATFNMSVKPNNGFATTLDHYNSYIDPNQNPGPQNTVVGLDPLGIPITGTDDKRMRANFLVGPQFSSDGERLKDSGADADDPDGTPITFTPYINELEPSAWRQSGGRISKWQYYLGMTSNLNNDFAVFRYADILLIKAEAMARKNGDWNDASVLDIVNQIRTQHGGVAPFTSLTPITFLAERGREMFAETWRRQDMIRFGTYNDSYLFHEKDPDNHVNIFPIPATQLNANKNLEQNPGY
jgi:hypothetical protein